MLNCLATGVADLYLNVIIAFLSDTSFQNTCGGIYCNVLGQIPGAVNKGLFARCRYFEHDGGGRAYAEHARTIDPRFGSGRRRQDIRSDDAGIGLLTRPAIGILDPHFDSLVFWIGYAAHQFFARREVEFPGYGGQHLAGIGVGRDDAELAFLVLGSIVLHYDPALCSIVRRFKFGRYRQHVD